MDERIENAMRLYERAVFEGDAAALAEAGRDLDGVEADLALARGRLLHVRDYGCGTGAHEWLEGRAGR
jgi:hypothetical protein